MVLYLLIFNNKIWKLKILWRSIYVFSLITMNANSLDGCLVFMFISKFLSSVITTNISLVVFILWFFRFQLLCITCIFFTRYAQFYKNVSRHIYRHIIDKYTYIASSLKNTNSRYPIYLTIKLLCSDACLL